MNLVRIFIFVVLAANGSCSFAQEFPTHQMRFIVPFPPGGGTDLISRVIAKHLGMEFNQPVVVDNRAGANGALGAEAAASAPADGHTLLMIISTHAVLPSLQKKLSYDLVRDFSAVTHAADLPNVIAARNTLPANSVGELIARARGEQLRYGSAGIGGPAHLAAALFAHMTGIDMLMVPYKGTGPALTDLLGGHIDLVFATTAGASPHIRSGRIKALAVTTLQRIPSWPELPTVSESGVKGYEFVGWYGVLVRAGTPRVVVNRLHSAITGALGSADARALIEKEGGQITGRGPEEFGRYINTEISRWAKIVKSANIKGE